jgi:ribosomal protein S18 acetylase RimI-like enzyme
MNNMLIWLLFFIATYQNIFAHQIRLLNKQEYNASEHALKNLYSKAFYAVYEEHWSRELNESILEVFTTYINRFNNSSDMLLVLAQEDSNIIGWVLFYIEKQNAIVELICVDPAHWRKGIGKSLLFSIKEYYPTIKSLAVITRKINNITPKFYESLGFKKSNFMLPEYKTEDMQGYELIL